MELRIFLSFLVAFATVNQAGATCMEDFQIRLTNADCSDPDFIDLCEGQPNCFANPIWLWPSNQPPLVAISSSTTCCGPPMEGSEEGSCSTDEHSAETTRANLENSGALILSDGDFNVMVPNFVATETDCGNEAVFVLDSVLEPGEGYQVGVYNLYSCSFNVFEASGAADPPPTTDEGAAVDVASDPGTTSDPGSEPDPGVETDSGVEVDPGVQPVETTESDGLEGPADDACCFPDLIGIPVDSWAYSMAPDPGPSSSGSSGGCTSSNKAANLWVIFLLFSLLMVPRKRVRLG